MTSTRTLEGAWVAVHVRINRERAVATELERRGYEPFLPLYLRRSFARRPNTRTPLFPGYVFCRYSSTNPFKIIQVNGVLRMLGASHVPMPVPDDEIEAIRRVVSLDLEQEPHQYLEHGDRVQIRGGPLSGLEGILVAFRNRFRLVISVTLLRRSVAVELDWDDVAPVSPSSGSCRTCHGGERRPPIANDDTTREELWRVN